ncbi:MAG: hypothetical protein WC337_06945 [Candidatus Muiribacteriota bacterium]
MFLLIVFLSNVTFATVLTLVVVPVIFHLVTSIKIKSAEILEKFTRKEEVKLIVTKVES